METAATVFSAIATEIQGTRTIVGKHLAINHDALAI